MDTPEEIQALYDSALEKYNAGDYAEAFKTFKQASDLGNIKATRMLGSMYLFGKGVEQDTETAIEYYTKSKSWNTIAHIYYEGMHCEPNAEEALRYYLIAAEEGDAGAMNMIGILYLGNEHYDPICAHLEITDYDKAFYWFKKSAKLKNVGAMINLAYCFYDGEGTPKNLEAARKLFLEVAEIEKRPLGLNTIAMGMLAKIYREKSDFEESFKWFKKAVEQGNFVLYFNEDEFFDFYLRDAQAGNVESMLRLGHLEEKRGNKAAYLRDAQAGNVKSMLKLGLWEAMIEGNKSASAAWYKRALDWDNPENIYDADTIRQIGDWYRNGENFISVEQDELKAIEWYHRAADIFNDVEAMLILADIYRKKSEEYSEMAKVAREIAFAIDNWSLLDDVETDEENEQ